MKLSAVVNCFNEELYINYALKSIYSYVDEIIVVDNCSTDYTVKRVHEFIEGHDLNCKVKLYVLEEPMQLGDVRNYALSKANNDWVVKWDGDFCAFDDSDVSNEYQAPFRRLLEIIESKKDSYDIFLLHSINISGDMFHVDKTRARLGLSGDAFVGRKSYMSYMANEKYGDIGVLKNSNGEKARLYYLNRPEENPMFFVHIFGVKPDEYLLYRRFMSEYQVWIANNPNKKEDFWSWLESMKNYDVGGGLSYVQKEIVKNMIKHEIVLPNILQPELDYPKFEIIYENDKPVSRVSFI